MSVVVDVMRVRKNIGEQLRRFIVRPIRSKKLSRLESGVRSLKLRLIEQNRTKLGLRPIAKVQRLIIRRIVRPTKNGSLRGSGPTTTLIERREKKEGESTSG